MVLRNAVWSLMCLAMTASLWGCGSDDDSNSSDEPFEVNGGAAGASTDGMGGSAVEGGSAAEGGSAGNTTMPDPNGDALDCDTAGFVAVDELAGATQFGLAYQAEKPGAAGGDAKDVMLTQIYSNFDGPTEPGRYELDGINYRDCGLCLLIQTDCLNGDCDKILYAEEGTVEITALGGDRFAATYENVVYREVTISDGESTSTVVEGGATWCANGYQFDQELRMGGGGSENTEEICAGPVACLEEEIANFSVTSCETNQAVSVRDYFEGSTAAVFLGTAGWCPACSERVPQLVNQESTTPGLKVMYVLGEDGNYEQPTQGYCEGYARSHNVPISQIFIDHDGEYGHANFFTNIWPYPSDGVLGLPYHAVMDPADWTYVYGDGGPSGSFSGALNSLLQ
jgi:hypothetical protein